MSDAMRRHALILGGARSGKTATALAWAEALGPRRRYVATAQAFDAEMAERIARHQAERGPGWETAEAPLEAAAALAAPGVDVVLLDCLTLWLSNLMHHDRDPETETQTLLAALAQAPAPVLMVSNEVGLGLVPETPLGRAFRDAQGRLNQAVAAQVGEAVFVAAGLPLTLKGAGPPLRRAGSGRGTGLAQR
jgi:adenosylcobinamide kinase/adenosylcobinamide-phosphate guanylyltransferase